jgi:hypothetical protein
MANAFFDDHNTFVDDMQRRLEFAAPRARIAIATCVADRLLPFYEDMVTFAQWGDAVGYRKILLQLWSVVGDDASTAEWVQNAITWCDRWAPDLDEISFPSALSAITALGSTLRCIEEDSCPIRATGACEATLDVAEGSIKHDFSQGWRNDVWSSALVRAEVDWLCRSLSVALDADLIDADVGARLRELAHEHCGILTLLQ